MIPIILLDLFSYSPQIISTKLPLKVPPKSLKRPVSGSSSSWEPPAKQAALSVVQNATAIAKDRLMLKPLTALVDDSSVAASKSPTAAVRHTTGNGPTTKPNMTVIQRNLQKRQENESLS